MSALDKKITAYLGRTPDFLEEVVIQDDMINGVSKEYIAEWNATDKAKPTDEQLDALSSQAETLENNAIAIRNRLNEYPSIGDVIDAIFKKEAGDSSEFDTLSTLRQTIKTKYPKESE